MMASTTFLRAKWLFLGHYRAKLLKKFAAFGMRGGSNVV